MQAPPEVLATCWQRGGAPATLPIEAFTIREAFTRLFYTLRIHGTGIFTVPTFTIKINQM